MYHYLHRLWYTKQNLLPHLAKTLRCAINFIWNLSAFICLSKCQCLFILLHIELRWYTFNQKCNILTLCLQPLHMKCKVCLTIWWICLLSHYYGILFQFHLLILNSFEFHHLSFRFRLLLSYWLQCSRTISISLYSSQTQSLPKETMC